MRKGSADSVAKEYRMNGSAAYEVSVTRESTAQPLRKPKRLPDAKVYYPPVKKEKVKLKVAPLTILGTATVAVLLFFVIFNYARLYEAKMAAAELEETYAGLLAEQNALTGQYESALDLGEIEERAREMGMSEPQSNQIVYVQIPDGAVETPTEEETDPISQVFASFTATVESAMEYFS